MFHNNKLKKENINPDIKKRIEIKENKEIIEKFPLNNLNLLKMMVSKLLN